MSDAAEIARAVFQAYAESDRAAAEALIAPDFHFTSPYDNRIDRDTYFIHCWPNHDLIERMEFLRAFSFGDTAVITYEGHAKSGKVFRNTEVLTVRNGKLVEAEVYFGWNLPHAAPEGTHIDPQ